MQPPRELQLSNLPARMKWRGKTLPKNMRKYVTKCYNVNLIQISQYWLQCLQCIQPAAVELVEPLATAVEAVAAGRLEVDLVKTLKWRAEFHQLVPGIHPFELQDLLQLEPQRQSVASSRRKAGHNSLPLRKKSLHNLKYAPREGCLLLWRRCLLKKEMLRTRTQLTPPEQVKISIGDSFFSLREASDAWSSPLFPAGRSMFRKD